MHISCVECVRSQGHCLPRLAAKGTYVCFTCGDRVMLPPSYFELLRTLGDIRSLCPEPQGWRATECRQSVGSTFRTYSTDCTRRQATNLTSTSHPFGRVVEVNYHPPVTRTYRTTTSITRENTVSPPVVKRETRNFVKSSNVIQEDEHISRRAEEDTFRAKTQAVEDTERVRRHAEEDNARLRKHAEEDQRRAKEIAEEAIENGRKYKLMEENLRLAIAKETEMERVARAKAFELEDKQRAAKIEADMAKLRDLQNQIDDLEREMLRRRDEEEVSRARLQNKWEDEDLARKRNVEEENLRRTSQIESDKSERERERKRDEESHAAKMRIHQQEDAQEKSRREQERAQWEREQKERLEKLDRDFKEREKKDQLRKERIERENQERERDMAERKSRVEKEKLQWEQEERIRRDRLEKERIERENLDRERRERLDNEERDRRAHIDTEEAERRSRIQKEEVAERNRIEKERTERAKEDQERKQREEKERLDRHNRDTAERDRLQREWKEKIDREKAEKDREDAERVERQKIELQRYEAERDEKQKREKDRFEAESEERRKLDILERERVIKERDELAALVKQELNRLEQARVEFERFEEEKKEKERVEQARIATEKEHARKLIEMIKNSRTCKDSKPTINKKTISFRQMNCATESVYDSKKIDLPSDSILSTTLNTLTSSRNIQSIPHPSRTSKMIGLTLGSLPQDSCQMADRPDTPSITVPKQKLPIANKLANISRDLNLDRFANAENLNEGHHDEDIYYQDDDFMSKPPPKSAIRYPDTSMLLEVNRQEHKIDYQQIEREAEDLRLKIKEGIAKKNGSKVKYSIVDYDTAKPASRSVSANKRSNIAQSVEIISRAKLRNPKKEALEEILATSDDKISLVARNQPITFNNPIIASKTGSKNSHRNLHDTDHFNSTDGSLQRKNHFRDNFYKTKSSIKFGMNTNPMINRTVDNYGIAFNASEIKPANESISKSRRDFKATPMRKSLYDSTVASSQYNSIGLGRGAVHSACSHQAKPCCSRFGNKTQAGHHCCHCFLIKSDVHNSNNKYNSALITLNTGSVLRSLIKESHCEENH
jgi:hypothetical protein